MDRAELYNQMAERKSAPKDFGTYIGDNGRVNRCVQLMKQGKIRTGGTLLDVGGGIGDLCFASKDLFTETVALDISSKNLEAAKSKGVTRTLWGDVDKSGLGMVDGSVDVVTALDFIEHIVDPENFARECYRVLKPSGEVFINTPNIQFWRSIESLIRGKMPHTSGDREVYHGGHLAFFTYDDLFEIFSKAGFSCVEQIHDEEGYKAPSADMEWVFRFYPPARNQEDYLRLQMRFGCPNLLFKAVCTK